MSCSPFDLRDYFLEELPDPQQRRQVEAHVKSCASCLEELDSLRITQAALRCMADEEIPQRIAFVSDKIFEPSPWRRWLGAFWNSGARLGFASAAMLSASLLVLAFKPAPAPVFSVVRPAVIAPAPVAITQTSASVSEEEVQQRIRAAVDNAVDLKTKDLLKQVQGERLRLTLAVGQLEEDERRMKRFQVQSADLVLAKGSIEDMK